MQRCCSAVQCVQPALSLPGHDAATGALSPGPGPSQPDHSPSPQNLPLGRPKVDGEKICGHAAGGEKLRNLLLPLECTADPLRQVRQSTRLQLCPRMHPGQTANNGVTERRKGGRSAFTRRQGNKAAVHRRSRILARGRRSERMPWSASWGPLAISAPSRGRYDSRPSLTGDVSSSHREHR